MKNSFPMKRIFTLSLAAFFALGCAFADYSRIKVPDTTEIRRTVLDSWINAPLSQVNGRPSEDYKDSSGNLFQVRAEREGQSTVIVVTPATLLKVTEIIGQTVVGVDDRPAFSRNSCGAWLLYRNRVSGAPEKIVIYFTESADVYLQLRADGKRTLADIMVCGYYLCRGVPLTVPFENLYTTSLQSIMNQTRKSLPWDKAIPSLDQYENISKMAVAIRRRLPTITYAADAAYNYKGELFSITTSRPFNETVEDEALNYWLKNPPEETSFEPAITVGASGFVKWVVDGLVIPLNSGRGTKILDLIPPTAQRNGISKEDVMSQKWNLSLNLDWNRHLAEKVYSLHTVRSNLTWEECGVDVTDNFFVSSLANDGRILPAVGYVKNVGYTTGCLKALLYVLAVTEPDTFFIGAVRHGSSGVNVFDSNAVFMPYFRENGKFDCVVFQNGEEMTINQFMSNNYGAYVHFERIKASSVFEPM